MEKPWVAIHLSPSLRRFNGGQEILWIALCKLEDLLTQLSNQSHSLKSPLFNSQGQLNGYINIYVNGQDFRFLDKQIWLQKTDKIEILTSLVGG